MHSHYAQNQRIELSLLLRLGHSQRQTATVLGVAPSTVCRELARNSRPGGYFANSARVPARSRRAAANTLRAKLPRQAALADLVEAKLRCNWSPQQIAGWLRVRGAASCTPVRRPSTTGCTGSGTTGFTSRKRWASPT